MYDNIKSSITIQISRTQIRRSALNLFPLAHYSQHDPSALKQQQQLQVEATSCLRVTQQDAPAVEPSSKQFITALCQHFIRSTGPRLNSYQLSHVSDVCIYHMDDAGGIYSYKFLHVLRSHEMGNLLQGPPACVTQPCD